MDEITSNVVVSPEGVRGFVCTKEPGTDKYKYSSVTLRRIEEDGKWNEIEVGGWVKDNIGIADMCEVGDYMMVTHGGCVGAASRIIVIGAEKLIPASTLGVARAYTAAWLLARKFGHGWAAAFSGEREIVDLLASCANTHEFADRADLLASDRNGENVWITTPYSPFSSHTTGSGRLEWLIEPYEKLGADDDVVITMVITRPDGEVLRSCERWDGASTIWTVSVPTEENQIFGGRHVDALEEPIHALGGRIEFRTATLLADLAVLGDAVEIARRYHVEGAEAILLSLRGTVLEKTCEEANSDLREAHETAGHW